MSVGAGQGQLFTDPSANAARAFFQHKSRKLEDKTTTVRDAVARFVGDGDYLAIGGFGADRLPNGWCPTANAKWSFASCHSPARASAQPSAARL